MAHWNTSVQTFFLPHDKLDNCSANLVCDENNSTFSSVHLPTDRCISDISAHSKSDTDEVAL